MIDLDARYVFSFEYKMASGDEWYRFAEEIDGAEAQRRLAFTPDDVIAFFRDHPTAPHADVRRAVLTLGEPAPQWRPE